MQKKVLSRELLYLVLIARTGNGGPWQPADERYINQMPNQCGKIPFKVLNVFLFSLLAFLSDFIYFLGIVFTRLYHP